MQAINPRSLTLSSSNTVQDGALETTLAPSRTVFCVSLAEGQAFIVNGCPEGAYA